MIWRYIHSAKRLGWLTTLVLGLVCAASLSSPALANANINPQISFQGKLTNPDGTNVSDGSYSIVFSLYTVASGGSNIWTETDSVTVAGGLFQVNLGAVNTTLGSVNWNNGTVYLGIKVGGDAEMLPRVVLGSAPQAFNSDKLGGIDSSGFIQLTPGSQQSGNLNISGTITSGAVNGVSLGSTIQPSSAGVLTVQSNGSNALTLTGGAASTWSTSAGALTITSAAAATWSTTAGNLTLQAGSGTVSLGSSTIFTANGALTINSNTAATLTLDSETTGNVNLGTGSNAKTITIGNTTGATAIATLVGASTSAFSVQGASSAQYLKIDTTNNLLYVGNSTADATAFVLVFDNKNTGGDPASTNGGEYYNSSDNKLRCNENSVWLDCLLPSSSSVADQAVGASTTAYLTGSLLAVPSGGLNVGTTFTWKITMSKTAAGTVANSFSVRVGTAGTTADTARLTFTMGTETAVADTAVVTITATVRSVSSTSTWAGNYQMSHNLTATGFDNASASKATNVTSGTFDDTTSGLKVGLSITTGASYSLTVQQVQASATNL